MRVSVALLVLAAVLASRVSASVTCPQVCLFSSFFFIFFCFECTQLHLRFLQLNTLVAGGVGSAINVCGVTNINDLYSSDVLGLGAPQLCSDGEKSRDLINKLCLMSYVS